MSKSSLDLCWCIENNCLLFVFFLKDCNKQKVAQLLPNKFKLSIKKKPIFSTNILRNYKVFQAHGMDFSQSNDIELFFQSINLEGQLCQVFIFLDRYNYEEGFSKSYFINHNSYFSITTLIIFDQKNQYNQQEMKSLTMQFQSIIILTQGLNLHEKILKISDSFAGKVSRQQDLKKFQILYNQHSIISFQNSMIDFNRKVQERKPKSLEQIERLIRYIETSRLNLFYVSQTDQEQSFSHAIKMKFNYQVLKILDEFTEEILKQIEYIMKTNLQSVVQCKFCYSFGYFSQDKELTYINTFQNSLCECPNSQQSLDQRQNLIDQCNQSDIDLSIQLLRKKFSIKYMLLKLEQIQQDQGMQDQGMQDQENTELKVNEELQKVLENLAALKTQRQNLNTYKFQIKKQNLNLQEKRDKIIKEIKFIELQIKQYEQQQMKLQFDQDLQ